MTELEQRAFQILSRCRLRPATRGKRFILDMCDLPEYKLTAGQVKFLWELVYLYRRQVKDTELLAKAHYVKEYGVPPELCKPGDHREPVRPTKPLLSADRGRPPKKTRLEQELERGKGRLVL